ncbi:hypothetical protein RF11_09500 [Thelohanellus kitauei]|uniref:Uncharacterized protein n=1 Tax=Thelohanellus kitauei TaxID=669202 RepID=A0A0C2IK34_THEKT|nr:hypothetical protein RF11_09500 [Thelohanellus kitauei]
MYGGKNLRFSVAYKISRYAQSIEISKNEIMFELFSGKHYFDYNYTEKLRHSPKFIIFHEKLFRYKARNRDEQTYGVKLIIDSVNISFIKFPPPEITETIIQETTSSTKPTTVHGLTKTTKILILVFFIITCALLVTVASLLWFYWKRQTKNKAKLRSIRNFLGYNVQ